MSKINKGLVVITGASAGIGYALAHKFAASGHPLLLISRNIKPFDSLKNKQVIYQQLDVCDAESLQQAITSAEQQYGQTECMINNAGFIQICDFRDNPTERCDKELDVLVKGVMHGIKAVLPGMSQRRSGTIINISSIADRKPYPQAVTYHASKHAVRSITESLQQAEAKHNVRVMNIAPGLIKTDIHKNMGVSFEQYCDMLGNPTFISADELADIVYFSYSLPQHICIRDMVVMPTDSDF